MPDAPLPVYQRWHAFDTSASQWAPVEPGPRSPRSPRSPQNPQNPQNPQSPQQDTSQPPTLRLLTWNTDGFGDEPEARMAGILSKLQQLRQQDGGITSPDVVFLQEVSSRALLHLLQHAWVREHWFSSEADQTNWAGGVPFATMTLLSRARFQVPSSRPSSHGAENPSFSLGPLWRVKYQSRYGRDALCCDILCGTGTARIRLINVHLDSLDIQPNYRPRQVAIAASLLRAAGVGRGLIAGDWNPVSPEDATLVQENSLVDAWERLHPGEDGCTWGLEGKGAPFPPGRLDKVAMLGLEPVDITLIHPEITMPPETTPTVTDSGGERVAGRGKAVEWSDHSGLLCTFGLGAAT